MKPIMKLVSNILVTACFLAAISAQASTSYQMNRLGFLQGDGCSYARCINDAGQVLGSSMSYGTGDIRGVFLWNHASGMVDIQTEGQFDLPGDINKNGQVVGTADSGYGLRNAVLRETNEELIQLASITEQSYSTSAYAINDNGWIAGSSGGFAVLWKSTGVVQSIGGTAGSYSSATDINNNGSIIWEESLYTNQRFTGARSYIWNQGINTLLQGLNTNDRCYAYSINDSGTVVGSSGNHAVVWGPNGAITLDLGIGTAYGINGSGQIVGLKEDKAVLWNPDGSIATDLGMLAGTNTFSIAYGINDSGQIVGAAGYNEYQDLEAVLWQPVPEPSSIFTLLFGMSGIGGIVWRRKKS